MLDLTELTAALTLTEAMFLAAINSDWEELDALQHQQSSKIKALSITSAAESEQDQLHRISELTLQVIELAEQHRQELGRELAQIIKTGSVRNAYLQNSE